MGFPLDRGTCRDGILTCHWHAARFDLRTGGTFDQFADDVQVFPVQVRGEEITENRLRENVGLYGQHKGITRLLGAGDRTPA